MYSTDNPENGKQGQLNAGDLCVVSVNEHVNVME